MDVFDTQKRNNDVESIWHKKHITDCFSFHPLHNLTRKIVSPLFHMSKRVSERLGDFSKLVCLILKPPNFAVLCLPFFPGRRSCRGAWLPEKWSFWNSLNIHCLRPVSYLRTPVLQGTRQAHLLSWSSPKMGPFKDTGLSFISLCLILLSIF